MKALTLYQPWATLIAIGAKRVETRPWATRYRGPLAIHAGRNQSHIGIDFDQAHSRAVAAAMRRALSESNYSPSPAFAPFLESDPARIDGVPIGAVVATCTLADVVPVETTKVGAHDGIGWRQGTDSYSIGDQEVPLGFYTPGRFAWLLADVEMLDPPIPARGNQHLWEWEGEQCAP